MIKIVNTIGMVAALSMGAAAATTVFLPSPYLSERDSPFYGGIVDNTGDRIQLENFEDGALNTPFVRAADPPTEIGSTVRTALLNPPDGRINGVDGDDGNVDGMTFAGDAWTTITNSGQINGFQQFEFLQDDQGRYPRYVGIVITLPLDFREDVEIAWTDPSGNDLFSDGEFDPREWSPAGGTGNGSPLLHRFIGIFNEDGVQTLTLGNVDQSDHLQYGFSIPEPSMALLFIGSMPMLLRRKRLR